MAARAYIPSVAMKAFPSSSSPSVSSTNVEAVTMEYELRFRRKYLWVEQAGGRQRVATTTTSEVEVRNFRPSSPSVFDHLMPLYPFSLLASFGIAEEDISLSEELREEMFCFVCNAIHKAKLAGNDRLKIVFTAMFYYQCAFPSAPSHPDPVHDHSEPEHDHYLEHAIRESWELAEGNTRRRRRSSDEESNMEKLKTMKYGSSSSSSSSPRYCFHDCRICLDEFLEEEELSLMPCGHAFHPPCILRWLSAADSCPTCRFQLC